MRYFIGDIIFAMFISWYIANIFAVYHDIDSYRRECCCNFNLIGQSTILDNQFTLQDTMINNPFCAHVDENNNVYYSFDNRINEVTDGINYTKGYIKIHNAIIGNYFCKFLGTYLRESNKGITLPNMFWQDECGSFIAKYK